MIINEQEGCKGKSGRVVIDCGFTKIHKDLWDTIGTSLYIENANCWLVGEFPPEKK